MRGLVHIYGAPDGSMPSDARWCDEPVLELSGDVEVIFHRQPEELAGTGDWLCNLCGVHTGSAEA